MSKTNRTALEQAYIRRHAVLDLIRSRPVGETITLTDVQKVCAYTSNGAASTLVKSMEKDGWLTIDRTRDDKGKLRNTYVINEDKITAKPLKRTMAAKPAKLAIIDVPQRQLKKPPLVNELEAQAVRQLVLEYYWRNQNDSLRQFVAWIEEQR